MHLTVTIALGVDVCKGWLDVFHSGAAQAQRFENSQAGLRALTDWLRTQPAVQVIVLEATGGYEALAFRTLSAAGFKVALLNPKRVRDFARGAGILAKTDRLDAAVLARYARAVGVHVSVPKSAELLELQAWLQRRMQLVAMQTAERNRRALAGAAVRKHIDRSLKRLQADIKAIDQKLKAALQAQGPLSDKLALLNGLKGLGPVVRAWLIAALPELGTLDRRRIAALVGVAPFACDSGSYRGQRHIRGGRAHLRCMLYLATLSATRHDPTFKRFYQSLLARGKAKKVALVACMRKLLTIINAVFRQNTPYRGRLAPAGHSC